MLAEIILTASLTPECLIIPEYDFVKIKRTKYTPTTKIVCSREIYFSTRP